jgi:alkaline phosphatase
MIGMTGDGTKYTSILEAARDRGMRTGLVVTSTITHATPACFGAHVVDRDMEDMIAEQLVESRINILFGGGKEYFIPKFETRSLRIDHKNLLRKAKADGYQIIETKRQLASAKGQYLLGLFAIDSLTTREPEPSLAEMTDKAIELLGVNEGDKAADYNDKSGTLNQPINGSTDNQAGFIMMVEGSQIDWASHYYNVGRLIRQVLLFDMAVREAVEFASRDGQTLVLVTSDHETCGLTINESKNGKDLELLWAVDTKHRRGTDGHTGQPVAVFAFGPRAENFCGVYDNTDIPKKIAALLGIKNFPEKIKD